jgi:hypothetical protein
MAFFTHCCKNLWAEFQRIADGMRTWLHAGMAVLAWVVCACPAWAQNQVAMASFQTERNEDVYQISAQFDLELSNTVQEALLKGIPVYFVVDAKVYRDRWYWSDKLVSAAQRHIRISYQPLTRRWRMQVASQPIVQNGLGVSLMQAYDSLEEVMANLRRLNRWKFADAAQIETGAGHRLEFAFYLDLSQLPRPLQMGAAGQSDWELAVTKSIRLATEAAR